MKQKILDQKKCKILFSKLFEKVGLSKEIYDPVVNNLIETSLRGVDSHGIRLVPHYLKVVLSGRINKRPRFKFKKTSPSTLILDADHSFGITAGLIAMEKAVFIAKKTGVCAVVVKNSTHFGAAAIFSLLAAKNNMIGLSFTHTESLVVPYGGRRPFLGTNPICFAAPMFGEEPFCLDMATPQISWNKMNMYKAENKELEKGWVTDENGLETTDPKKAIYLLPIGSYKGYGLGLMIEILCSLLSGMPSVPDIVPMVPVDNKKRELGHFFLAIDISRFQPVSTFKKRLKILVNNLRSQSPAEGFDKVRVAGDPQKEFYKIRSKKGIPLLNSEYEDLINISEQINIDKKYYSNLLK